MIIKKQGDEYFTLEDPEGSISLSLPGYIILFADNLQQMFRNSRNLDYKALPRVFHNIDVIRGAAECYTDGVANKQKVIQKINDPQFLIKYEIKEEQKKLLVDLIKNNNFTPPNIRQQLFIHGFSRVADELHFSEPRPELLKTCEIFWGFIRAIREESL